MMEETKEKDAIEVIPSLSGEDEDLDTMRDDLQATKSQLATEIKQREKMESENKILKMNIETLLAEVKKLKRQLKEAGAVKRKLELQIKSMSAEDPAVMNDTEKDAKIPEALCIEKEHHDPSEKVVDIKEENVEYSAQADNACEYQFSPVMLLSPKQESGDGSIPDRLSKASVCKGTSYKVCLNGQLKREDIEYNANSDTIEQVFLEDLPKSKGDRTSTCETLWTGISQEEVSGLDDNERDLELEDDDYLSENCLEIPEEISRYNTHPDGTSDVQSLNLWLLPERKGNTVKVKLMEKKRRRHIKEKPFTCDVCKKSYTQKSGLDYHMRVHTNERPFTCDHCNKAFTCKSTLVHHIRIHTKEKPYTCDICSKAFNKKSKLTDHTRIHTKEKPYICDVCNKAFIQKSSLDSHMRVHKKKERPYTCDICNKSYSNKSTLVMHIRTHAKERPFPCDICNKAFIRKSKLNVHMRVHTKEKPYICDVCNKSFSERSSLTKHKRVHTKEKPYTCHVCNKSYSARSTLVRHKQMHAKENPITCSICNKSFKKSSTLVNHMLIHTKKQPSTL